MLGAEILIVYWLNTDYADADVLELEPQNLVEQEPRGELPWPHDILGDEGEEPQEPDADEEAQEGR